MLLDQVAGEKLLIEGVDVVDQPRHGVTGQDRATSLAERRAELGVGSKPRQHFSDRFDVAGRDEEARLAVGDDVVNAADVRGNDWEAGRQRLDQGHWGALVR